MIQIILATLFLTSLQITIITNDEDIDFLLKVLYWYIRRYIERCIYRIQYIIRIRILKQYSLYY